MMDCNRTHNFGIGAVAAIGFFCLWSSRGELLNGGFEDGTWSRFLAPESWTTIAFNHQVEDAETTVVFEGKQSLKLNLQSWNSIVPVVSQKFDTGDAGRVVITGRVQTTSPGSTAALRVRENRLGDAGTVMFWKVDEQGDGSWMASSVRYADDAKAYSVETPEAGDVFGLRQDHSLKLKSPGEWTEFVISFTPVSGEFEYAIDLGAVGFDSNENNAVYFDDLKVAFE
jgi:hypothetical protein